jgi:two-component system, OmpR family, phosphate regulon sensor histidine kinase PhoR
VKKFLVSYIVILVIVVMLPVSFFVLKQISSMSENEKMVKEIFDKQIETILFSLNQTSENIFNLWVSRIDLPIETLSDKKNDNIQQLFQINQSIYNIELYNFSKKYNVYTHFLHDSLSYTAPYPDKETIDKLKDFLQAGYQRIEGVRDGEFTNLYFLPRNAGKNLIGIITIKTNTFIEQNLGANFQQVAQDIFTIQVFDQIDNIILYSVHSADEKFQDNHKQNSWYLPGIEFGIELRSGTIDTLVKDRSKRDFRTLVYISIVVIAGIVFLIITILKEVKLAEMKSEFISNVSHEIRTPLALISMYAETLLLGRVKSKEKEKEYFSIVFNETNRLSEMVNRILSFSKMEKKKRKYSLNTLDVNELLSDIYTSYQPQFVSNSVEVTMDLSENLPLILGDREALTECMINLLDNSIKYGKPENKKIDVRTIPENRSIRIEIEDNGIGIHKKHQQYIFDKFYRITSGNLAHQSKGTGLGLSIVKQIIEGHRGKIFLRSVPDEGSCFSLKIPIKRK